MQVDQQFWADSQEAEIPMLAWLSLLGAVGPVTHDHQDDVDDVADPSRVDQLIRAKEQLEQYT